MQLEELRRLPIATCCARRSRVERCYTICLCSNYPLLRSRWRLCALRMRHTPCGCRSAHLVEVQTNLLLPTMHTVSIMRTAASEAMPLRQAIPGLIESEVERSYVRVTNRRQSDSENRSRTNRIEELNAATPRAGISIPEASRSFKPETANLNAFLLGFQRGYSLLRKRISPLTRAAPLALLPRGTRAATHFAPKQNCTENFPKTY